MLEISENDILNRMRRDNPWWDGKGAPLEDGYPRRDYFNAFNHLISQRDIKRAVVLMGPRQVGKTVMAKQAIAEKLKSGERANEIFFASLDTPMLIGQALEKLLRLYLDNFGNEKKGGWIFFDEVQYLKDWEVHLKSLVDSYPNIKFVVTGSAAAVLKRKSQESGAGRFSDFILPPLTFAEFLRFQPGQFDEGNIELLNKAFMDYLAYGGYPEIVTNPVMRENADQFLKSDIIDKVLLRDLPSLYGVTDVQEMHRLFSALVYNTGQEVSLEKLSHNSGVSKATLKKYIEYFEAAFLIRKLSRIDENAKSFKRETFFKVYVTNPALYSALFGAPKTDSEQMGALAETAFLAQIISSYDKLGYRYARWKSGEIDLVLLNSKNQKPFSIHEVKWSDRVENNISIVKNLCDFADRNNVERGNVFMTTKSYQGEVNYRGVRVDCVSTAVFCKFMALDAVKVINERVGYQSQPELPL